MSKHFDISAGLKGKMGAIGLPGLPGAKGVAGIPGQPGREVIIPDLFPVDVIGSVLNTTLSMMERGETYFLLETIGMMPSFLNCQRSGTTQTLKV